MTPSLWRVEACVRELALRYGVHQAPASAPRSDPVKALIDAMLAKTQTAR